jgi:flagellar biosynthesis protein FlhG
MTGANAAIDPPLPRTRAAPIYAVASGKGGVGKTWLSTMLSIAFGRAGQRALLVDCDLGLANVDVQLGIRAQHDLASVIHGFHELNASVTPVLGGPGRNGGFDLIAGRSGTGELGATKLEEVARVANGLKLHNIAAHYDRIILDLAAGIDPTVLRFARAADKLIVVTNEEPTALTDAYAIVKLLRLQGSTLVPWVIVNMAENRVKGRKVYRSVLARVLTEYLELQAEIRRRDHARPARAGFNPRTDASADRAIRTVASVRRRNPHGRRR